jgi:hypothetical protein
MSSRLIVLGRYDLVEEGKVKNLININEKKTFRKTKLITNTYSFECDNDDDFFSVTKPGSIFHGSNWRYSLIQAFDPDNNKIWEGVILDILRDHERKKARLICKNTFFTFRKEIVNYESSGWETGAAAFKNICDAVGFTKYNMKAYLDSNAQLDAAGCYLKCFFNTEDGMPFMEAISKVAEYSNADLYVHNDELYFVHWQPFTGGVTITIEGDRKGELRKAPIVSQPEKDIINDFSIDYDGSDETPATDANSNNIGEASRTKFGIKKLPGFRTSSSGQIVFKDKTSATYMGESYIKETNRNWDTQPEPPQKNMFSVAFDYRKLITLGTFFRFNFSEEGWENKIFETFEFTKSEEGDEIKIVAYDV